MCLIGGICSAKVFGQTFIILNDQQVVHDLLDARGATYSDRPQTVTLRLGGFTRSTTLMSYNDEWKEHRKVSRPLELRLIGTSSLITMHVPSFWLRRWARLS